MGIREGIRLNWRLCPCSFGSRKEGVPKKGDKGFVREDRNLAWERKEREDHVCRTSRARKGERNLKNNKKKKGHRCLHLLPEQKWPSPSKRARVIAGGLSEFLHGSKGAAVSGMEPWKRLRLRIILGCFWGGAGVLGRARKLKKKKDMNYISQTHALIVQSLLSRTVLGTMGNAEKQDMDPVPEKVNNNVERFHGRMWTEAKASRAEKGQTSHDTGFYSLSPLLFF